MLSPTLGGYTEHGKHPRILAGAAMFAAWLRFAPHARARLEGPCFILAVQRSWSTRHKDMKPERED